MWGRGLRGNSAACSTLCQFSVTSHNQIGTFWCQSLGGWACVHSRTLWISPMNSPVGLGVLPTATSTPTGVLSQRFSRLYFPALEPWVARSVLLSSCSSQFIHMRMWDPPVPPAAALMGLPAAALPAPLHNPPPHRSSSHHLATSPVHLAACLRPSYRSG